MSEHKYDKDGQCEVCGQHMECHPADVRTVTLVEALEWYATATYPNDGSGRPADAFRKIAADALAKVKEGA